METTTKRGRGRPPAPEAERRRSNLTLRVRSETRSALERAAAENARSLSEEAELRLDYSVRAEQGAEQLLDFAYGRPLSGLLLLLARVLREAGSNAGFATSYSLAGANAWMDNPYAYDQGARAVTAILEALRPPGEVTPPKFQGGPALLSKVYEQLGSGFASAALLAVAGEDLTQDLGVWGERVRQRLSPSTVERIKAVAGRKTG